MNEEMSAFYLDGRVGDVGEWIRRSVAAYADATADADVRLLVIVPIGEAYPTEDTAEATYELGPKQTISVAFMLGYCAGVLRSPEVASTYEAVYRTLESMHFHYKVTYGLERADGEAPHFVVKTPGDPNRHLRISVATPTVTPAAPIESPAPTSH
jgi:hypothetical protein